MRRLLLYILFLPPLIACDGNYRRVVINGQVKDSVTGDVIAGSKINVVCWVYDTKIWESRKIIKDTVSDENGRFSIPFEKGEAIDIEVSYVNYEPIKYSKTLDRSVNGLDFKLKKLE